MVPVHGFEPQFAASKADVLPLDETGKIGTSFSTWSGRAISFQCTDYVTTLWRHSCWLSDALQSKKPELANPHSIPNLPESVNERTRPCLVH